MILWYYDISNNSWNQYKFINYLLLINIIVDRMYPFNGFATQTQSSLYF